MPSNRRPGDSWSTCTVVITDALAADGGGARMNLRVLVTFTPLESHAISQNRPINHTQILRHRTINYKQLMDCL